MVPPDLAALVRKEQIDDLVREAAHDQLIRAVRTSQGGRRGPVQLAAWWLGAQMVQWGNRLQKRVPEPVCCASCCPAPV
jgi:hypothetical protein